MLLLLLALTSVTGPAAPRLAIGRPASFSQLLIDARAFSVPAYELFAFRSQVAIVYFFAGLWKLNPDWVLHGEPLTTWLWAFGGLPVVGGLLTQPWVGLAMAWAGAVFDLSIWALLMWRRSARVAFAVCVGFHVTVWLLFPIGVFSWVMLLSASVLLPEGPAPEAERARPWSRTPSWRLPVLAAFVLMLAVLPMRGLVDAEGVRWHDINWDEDGYRFSWRVMLNEKAADFSLRARDDTHPWKAWPYLTELTALQARQMSYQADMILAYAHHVCARLGPGADVRASSYVAWNGRRAAPLLVDVNLCEVDDPQAILRPRPTTPAGRR